MTNKSKSVLYLIAALIVLIAVFIFWQNPLSHKSSQSNVETILTKSLDNVQKIEITKDSKTTLLNKTDDKWVVTSENNAEANPEFITKLLDSLKEVKTGTIISQNPDKLISFELAEGMGTTLKLSDNENNPLLELQIGKMGAAYTQCYVKLPNSSNVLLISQNLLLSVTPTSWVKPAETTNTNASTK
ncbi:MAG: DUF4340 domain-containing protein [Candidatus Parcubacteria bacterium]|nr:DUF4340 domain-containing protein [Candidatus Parcubacteria bacterium]